MKVWTKRKVAQRIHEGTVRHFSHAADAVVGASYDVLWGFLTVDEAMEKYFDGIFWPHVTLTNSTERSVRSLLVELEVFRDRSRSN